jgi:hypothetical protein
MTLEERNGRRSLAVQDLVFVRRLEERRTGRGEGRASIAEAIVYGVKWYKYM